MRDVPNMNQLHHFETVDDFRNDKMRAMHRHNFASMCGGRCKEKRKESI